MTEGLSEERLAELETIARGMASRNRRGANVDETLDLIAEVRRLRSWSGVLSLLDQHYPTDIFDGSSGDPGSMIIALTRENEALRSRPCPHVVTGDEGTAYCDLAESSVRALRERVAGFESVLTKIANQDYRGNRCSCAGIAHRALGGDGQ